MNNLLNKKNCILNSLTIDKIEFNTTYFFTNDLDKHTTSLQK